MKILNKYKIKKPFIIYTGSLYPHKNVIRLIKAVKKIKGLNLVVVCSRNVFWQRFKEDVKKLKVEDQVVLAGFIPDEELVGLYQQAEAFIFPSLWEGFGLPGLEAMAAGLPVLAAKASCLPEVYGQAALYFDPYDIDDIANKINNLLKNKKLKIQLIKLGYEQVKKYSWQKMTEETLAVYENSLSL